MTYEEKTIRRMLETFEELPEERQTEFLDTVKYNGILAATADINKTKTVYFGDLMAEAKDRQQYFNKQEGYLSGLKYFDDSIMGFRPGEMIVVAGPSNFGKTMIGLNLIANTVLTSKKKALVISLEMTALEIVSRVYNMVKDDYASMDIMTDHLIIQTELSVSARHVQAMIEKHNPDIVLLDHIQFLAHQEKGTEYERITTATAKVKRMAIENSIPIILISHVAKTRSGDRGQATASDLKGTSSIEQDCDVGFMINRKADQLTGNEVEITLFKHRTKRPDTFHKDCVLAFDGVKLRNQGEYECDERIITKQPKYIPKDWIK